MTSPLSAATLIGGVLIIFGLAALLASLQIDPDPDGDLGARIFPLVGAVSIALLGVVEMIGGLTGKKPAPFAMGDRSVSVFTLLLISIAYIFLISKFGYLIATGVSAFLALWMFGVRNPIGLLIAMIACPAVYHLIFFELLGVFPPFGEWFDLLDVIRGE